MKQQKGFGKKVLIACAAGLIGRTHTKRADVADPVVDELPDAVDVVSGAPIPESRGLQTNNPGFPGWASEGWLWAGMLSVSMQGARD